MNNKWWENYDDEPVVLLEDVGKTHEWMGDFLKIWADRYGFRSEQKYGSLVLRPEKIVVTSNYHPTELWPDSSVHEPILRRFKVRHIEKLEIRDITPVTSRKTVKAKRHNGLTDKNFTPKKPALMRQDANGNIVENSDRQPIIECVLDAGSDDDMIVVDEYCTECHIYPCICKDVIISDDNCLVCDQKECDCFNTDKCLVCGEYSCICPGCSEL